MAGHVAVVLLLAKGVTLQLRHARLSEIQMGPQVLTQEARYSFTHAIAPEDFCGGRRLSVTFRQSPLRR